jgi:hypothetical protein
VQADQEVIYRSSRSFEVWNWGVGHRGLLLRSNPTTENTARIEVWFKPAYAVHLSSNLVNLEILGASEPVSEAASALLGRTLEAWERVFVVRGGGQNGWVVAGGVHGREDDGTYDAPPIFDGWALKTGRAPTFQC